MSGDDTSDEEVGMSEVAPEPSLPRRLTVVDGIAVTFGAVVGTGIFASPGVVMAMVQQTGVMLFIWLLGGFMVMLGCLCFAELGTAVPSTGGDYVYLTEIHPCLGFTFIWAVFLCLKTGSQAIISLIFARYLGGALLPSLQNTDGLDGDWRIKFIALAAITAVVILNIVGTQWVARAQRTFLASKILAIVFLCAMALYSVVFGDTWAIAEENLANTLYFPPWDEINVSSVFWYAVSIGNALIASLWAYDGFNGVNMIAGELKRPERTIPLSILLAISMVVACYVGANIAYLAVLSPDTLIHSQAVAITVANIVWGSWAAIVMGLFVSFSALGTLNSSTLTGSRLFYAAAMDEAIPLASWLRAVSSTFNTPYMALLLQGSMAGAMVLIGSFESLLNYFGFTAWVFYALCGFSVIWIRMRRPQYQATFRVRPYPLVPVVFILSALVMVGSTFISSPLPTVLSTVIVGSAIPFYFCFYWRGNLLAQAYQRWKNDDHEEQLPDVELENVETQEDKNDTTITS